MPTPNLKTPNSGLTGRPDSMRQRHTERLRQARSIGLQVPWGTGTCEFPHRASSDTADETAALFIAVRTRLHETYIRETERSRRLRLVLMFSSIVSAACLRVFAAEGRETSALWWGACIVICAAGLSGYGRVWVRMCVGTLKLGGRRSV